MNRCRHSIIMVVALLVLAVVGCRTPERPAASDATPAAEPVAVADNEELQAMFEADQGERMTEDGKINWAVVAKNDKERQARVLELESAGLIRTGNDYFHAAMIFQHGSTPEDYERAHQYAKKGVELGSSHPVAKWLIAATWDRWQMSRKLPQWYGTQYIRRSLDGPLELYTIDETAVTDDDRRALGVPTLAEAKQRLVEMNGERQESTSP
jgi:hypothetical protein